MEIDILKNSLELQNLNSFQKNENEALLGKYSTNPGFPAQLMSFIPDIFTGLAGGVLGPGLGAMIINENTIGSYVGYGALGGFVVGLVSGGITTFTVAFAYSYDKKTTAITLLAKVALSTLVGAVFGIPMGALYSYVGEFE